MRFQVLGATCCLLSVLAVADPARAQTLWASSQVLEHLYRLELQLSPEQRQKLLSLDAKSLRPNGQVDLAELDLSGDGQVTRKEIQFVLSWQRQQLAGEGLYRLQTQPRLLPNRTITGNLQLHINNPEQVRDPGLLFDSQQLRPDTAQEPLQLGVGLQRDFDVYAYVNYQALRTAYAQKPDAQGRPLQTAWYAYHLANPPGNPVLAIQVQGSGLVNTGQSPFALQMLGQLPPDLTPSARLLAAQQILHATRSQDAELQDRALTGQRTQHDQQLQLAPGQSLLITQALPFSTGSDYRGQYRFSVSGQASLPLHVQAAVLTELPDSAPLSDSPVDARIWKGLLPGDSRTALTQQLSHWVEPRADGSTQFLKPSSDFSSPQALAAELRQQQYPALLSAVQDLSALWRYLDSPPDKPAPGPQEASPDQAAPVPDAEPLLDPTTAGLPSANAGESKAALPAFLLKNKAPLPDLVKLKTALNGQAAASLLQAWLGPAELEAYLLRLDQLASKLEQAPGFDAELMHALRAWNAEIKMLPRVLAQADEISDHSLDPALKTVLKTFEHRFWGCLIALGRVNGVVRGQGVQAQLPAAELTFAAADTQREWNYLLNSNPLNTGGVLTTGSSQTSFSQTSVSSSNHSVSSSNQIDALPLLFQSGHTLAPPPMNYGQYGVSYQITGRFRNQASVPAYLQVSFGSSDEMGHLDWHSLFDQTDSLMGDGSTRFTGSLRLHSVSQGQVSRRLISVVHDRVQAPQALLATPLRIDPGEQRDISLDLVIPTNSTGPQVLQFRLERSP